jgi:hypothetical protein
MCEEIWNKKSKESQKVNFNVCHRIQARMEPPIRLCDYMQKAHISWHFTLWTGGNKTTNEGLNLCV